MGRPVQDVRIFQVQDRRESDRVKRPWVVRRRVDGKDRSTSFPTQALADRYRARLLLALEEGERFDRSSGEPVSWRPGPGDELVHTWVRRWIAEQWEEWAPRTRTSAIEAMSRFIPLVRTPGAVAPNGLRRYLVTALAPDAEIDLEHPLEAWMQRHGLVLNDLNRNLLATVETQLGRGLKGQTLSREVAGRYRKTSHACIRRAVDLEAIPVDPWPPRQPGRSRRKVNRKRCAVDIRILPGPATMARAIAKVPTHQPGSRMYEVMTAVAYYAGLRPSEVVMLRPRALALPTTGWGRIDVVEADVGYDEPGDPKEGERSVPIPPALVRKLRAWITEHGIAHNQLMFRTRNNRRPASSNWSRALRRAFAAIDHAPITPYGCRHHVDRCRRAARRGRPPPRPQRRNPRIHVRRRPGG